MSVGARLQEVHAQFVDEPMPEWLDGAACGPAVKHLAHLALHTAESHGSEAEWRQWVHTNVPEASDKLIDEAEDCMRGSGLWPWQT